MKMYERINTIEEKIGLDELKGMFEGKLVSITNTGPIINETEGICKEVKISEKYKNLYEILLTNRVGYLFGHPSEVGDNFVEGTLPDETKGSRRIEVINKEN